MLTELPITANISVMSSTSTWPSRFTSHISCGRMGIQYSPRVWPGSAPHEDACEVSVTKKSPAKFDSVLLGKLILRVTNSPVSGTTSNGELWPAGGETSKHPGVEGSHGDSG